MSVFENTLPPFPDGVGDSFIILYDAANDSYTLENQFRPDVHYNASTAHYTVSRYSSGGNTQRWNYYNDHRGWINVYGLSVYNDPIILNDTTTIIYSSVDLMYNDNVWYAADTPERLSSVLAVNGSISSSTIYKSLMSDVLPVLGVVFLTVIGCLAFRKAWKFFSGLLNKG